MADATANSRDVFPFFRLARELRDLIYDASLVTRKLKTAKGLSPYISATGTPATNLLLVSRKFNEEYRARAAQNLALEIEDYSGFSTGEGDVVIYQFPSTATAARSVTLNLACFTETPVDEWKDHHAWISDTLCQLPQLRSLSVRLSLPNEMDHAFIHALDQNAWLEYAKAMHLEVYKMKEPEDGAAVDQAVRNRLLSECTERYELIGRWNKYSGEVEAIQKD